MAQTQHVCLQDSVKCIKAVDPCKHGFDLRSAAVDEELRVDTEVVLFKLVDESVLEESLGNSNKNCTSQNLEKLDTGSADRNPFLCEDRLHNQNGGLETSSDAQAGNNLVTEPLLERAVDVESRKQARSDGIQNHAWNDDVVVVTNDRDETTRKD